MRKLALPLSVFILGLCVADYFFGLDIPELFRGFGSVVTGMFAATRT
ncbi:MAG: hypothetical protein NDI73_09165 [Desulfuromonadales bacterium]|nr:hypothetical protein [Desulfuromonadales bacterium]